MPNSADSERALLGSILLDNAVMPEAVRMVSASDFYTPSHRQIFSTMAGLFDANEPINTVTIAQELTKQSSLETVGGWATLTNLTYGIPHFASIKPFAKVMLETSQRRRLVKLGGELYNRALDSEETGEELVRWLEAQAHSMRAKDTDSGANFIGDLIDPQLERFARMYRGMSDAIETGIPEVDKYLTGGGLVRGFMTILAARPSFGKTAFALDLAENAIKAGKFVYFATIEMLKEVLIDRLFAVRAQVPRYKISTGMSNQVFADLLGVADDMRGLPFVIDDQARGCQAIRRNVRDKQREIERPIDLVVVDYLQLMQVQKGGTRNNQVGANALELQEIAKEFNCAVLVLSQLSREHVQSGREPELIDLRDSGDIEAHCRNAFFLFGEKEEWRDGVQPPAHRDVIFKCAKQGEGPLFRSTLVMDTQLITFR